MAIQRLSHCLHPLGLTEIYVEPLSLLLSLNLPRSSPRHKIIHRGVTSRVFTHFRKLTAEITECIAKFFLHETQDT